MRDSDLIDVLGYLLGIFPDIHLLLDELENDASLPCTETVSIIVNEVAQFVDVINSCSLSLHEHNDHPSIGDYIKEILAVTADLVVDLKLSNARLTNKCLVKVKRPVGRPKLELCQDQVNSLVSLGFTWKKIASLLGVSERALRYKKLEFQIFNKYSEIGDNLLDDVVRDIFQNSPNSGERMVTGALLTRGYRVQRERIRTSINRVNPNRNALARRIKRRVYNVAGPNSLW